MIIIFKHLHKELVIFLLSILIATIIIVFSSSWHQSSLENRNNTNNSLNQATSRYYTGINRKQVLEKYEDKYKTLVAMGVAADENRLQWIDAIEKATTAHKIPYLKYTLDKQQKLNSSSLSVAYPGIDIFRSSMKLHMQLLHEGDLFLILNTIDTNARGLFDVQSCSLTNNNIQAESLLNSTSNMNFAAICTLNWYTVKKKTVSLPTNPSRRS